MDDSPASSSKTLIGEVATTSCERCRRRKIKCDRRQPCGRCRKAGTECARGGTGEKQRPVPKSYVQALETQVAHLELFIQKLASADNTQRDEMLTKFRPNRANVTPSAQAQDGNPAQESPEDDELGLARARAGQLRKLAAGNAAHFYGATSLFQIHLSEESSVPLGEVERSQVMGSFFELHPERSPDADGLSPRNGIFQFAPHDDVSQRLMATFFKEQYQYNMCIYREYFLRDYDVGTGRYYSDLLMYAICALGALATGNPLDLTLSEVFSNQAQSLLYYSLDSPDLTALQALVLLGQREIGHGRASKGWLFCGMAFRLAHEMGLHLDPNNWNGTAEPDIDREVLRRVYWATFITDKQLSLYFGRPPALYPHESDVRNTVRLPYPPDWEGLLDTYIAKGTYANEDGIAFVGAFIYQAELAKIVHSMITDLFENRRSNADTAVVTATVQQIHVSLARWLTSLPGKLHWNQWTVGKVPSSVLHLHMIFHTAMIILHRPPRHLFKKPGISTSEDVEICYESLQAILRLMRSYSRHYRYDCLPLDFVHTLSTAAGTILMKRYLENTPWDDAETSRSLGLVLQAMDSIKGSWPCVTEIQESIMQARQKQVPSIPETDPVMDLGFMAGITGIPQTGDETLDAHISDADFGPMVADFWADLAIER